MRIHWAGYKVILTSFFILITFNVLLCVFIPVMQILFLLWIIPSLVLMVLILRFFRYPKREVKTTNPDDVVAAADGVIVTIETVENERFFEGKAIQISTFMSPYNVHLNWVPVIGTVEQVYYLPGKYLLARHPKSSMLNEMSCVVFRHSSGQRVVSKQIAGFVARRILPFLKKGDHCKYGDELGFIRFGSRVDIILSPEALIHVSVGMKVKGLKTILATLPKSEGSNM